MWRFGLGCVCRAGLAWFFSGLLRSFFAVFHGLGLLAGLSFLFDIRFVCFDRSFLLSSSSPSVDTDLAMGLGILEDGHMAAPPGTSTLDASTIAGEAPTLSPNSC